MAIMLAIGSAIIKPDNSGFFPDNQLANAIIKKEPIWHSIWASTTFSIPKTHLDK